MISIIPEKVVSEPLRDEVHVCSGHWNWFKINLGAITLLYYWGHGQVANMELLLNTEPESYLDGNTLLIWVPLVIRPTWYNLETMEPEDRYTVLKRTSNFAPLIQISFSSLPVQAKLWRVSYRLTRKDEDVKLTLPKRYLRDEEIGGFKKVFETAHTRCILGSTDKILKRVLDRCF